MPSRCPSASFRSASSGGHQPSGPSEHSSDPQSVGSDRGLPPPEARYSPVMADGICAAMASTPGRASDQVPSSSARLSK
jgi:hypothetical protein